MLCFDEAALSWLSDFVRVLRSEFMSSWQELVAANNRWTLIMDEASEQSDILRGELDHARADVRQLHADLETMVPGQHLEESGEIVRGHMDTIARLQVLHT